MNKIFTYAAAFWLVLMVIAIVNGIARELYAPLLNNDDLAHQVSVFTGMAVFLVAVYLFLNHVDTSYGGMELIVIGVMWLTMTVIFEFTFGHYVVGHSFDELLADYNILEGRLWPLFLLTIAVAPYILGEWAIER